MKSIARILSIILCFQLAVGCNGSGSVGSSLVSTKKSPVPVPDAGNTSETVEISGSITSILRSAFDLILPSAAAAEGKLIFYDVTDPASPVELNSVEISGQDIFSVQLNKSDVTSKLIKAVYISSEGEEKSRELLFDMDGSENAYDASLDLNSSMRSKIFEAQLMAENVSDFNARFKEIKNDSLSSEIAALGDSNNMAKLLLDPNLSRSVAELIARSRMAIDKGDYDSSLELKKKLFYVAMENNVVSGNAVLNCSASSNTIFFKDQKFKVYAKPIEANFSEMYNGIMDLGGVSNQDEANKVLKELSDKLVRLHLELKINVSARIYFESAEGESQPVLSCRLFGQKLSETEMAELEKASDVNLMNPEIMNSLVIDKLDNIDQAIGQLDELYRKTNYELKEKFASSGLDPLAFQTSLDSINRLFESRVVESYYFFYPSVDSSKASLDLSYFHSVKFENIRTTVEAYDQIKLAYEKTVSAVNDQLKESGLDSNDIELIRNEKINLAKYIYDVRVREMQWYFGN